MSIDWITVSAQIVNFLILVWLLKRFLYRPVIRAMEKREQSIAQRARAAVEREQKANEEALRYRNERDQLERERESILARAKQEAEQQKKVLLGKAREEVAATRRDWQRQANQEKEEFCGNLRRQSARAIQTIAGKALRDLAGAGLEEQIIEAFLERLQSLDAGARNALAEAAEPVLIASAFELDSSLRGRVTRAIHEQIAGNVVVDYSVSPQLLCGIELTRGGRRLSWSLADYMENLTSRIEAAFSPTENALQTEPDNVATTAG